MNLYLRENEKIVSTIIDKEGRITKIYDGDIVYATITYSGGIITEYIDYKGNWFDIQHFKGTSPYNVDTITRTTLAVLEYWMDLGAQYNLYVDTARDIVTANDLVNFSYVRSLANGQYLIE